MELIPLHQCPAANPKCDLANPESDLVYAGVRLGVSQVRLGSSGVRHREHAPGTALFPLAFPLMEKIKHTDEEPSKGTRIYEKIKEHNADAGRARPGDQLHQGRL